MRKNKNKMQSQHLYLGVGGVLAIAALVVALTFGMTNAQSPDPNQPPPGNCSAPMYWNGTACVAPTAPTTPQPPAGGCPTPQYWDGNTCTSSGSTYNQMPLGSCPAGQYWNGTVCMSGTTTPQPNTQTSPHCLSSYSWDSYKGVCWNGSNQVAPTSCPSGQAFQMPDINNGGIHTSSWCGSGTTTTPSPATSYCVAPSVWTESVGVCMNGSNQVMPVLCPAGKSIINTYDSMHSVPWCGTAGSTTTMQPPACPSSTPMWCSQLNRCGVNLEDCSGTTTTGMNGRMQVWNNLGLQSMIRTDADAARIDRLKNSCARTPANANIWMSGGGDSGSPDFGMPDAEKCQRAANCTANQIFNGVTCSASMNTTPTPTACPSGQYWNGTLCVRTAATDRPIAEPMQPGSCPTEMLACPDRWNPANKICYARQIYDYKSNAMRPATCTDFNTQPTTTPYQPMPNQPVQQFFGEQRTTAEPYNPCQYNPNDPFCKAGVNFQDLQRSFEFDQKMYSPAQLQVRNIKQEVRNLKREAKEWARDAKQARRQLVEVSRETSGFACPVAVEVDALVTEFDNAVRTVDALTEASSEDAVQTALAMREHINGIRTKLFGGALDPDTGDATPGKMQGLSVCREISGIIYSACEAAKHVEREYAELKKGKAPASSLEAFEEVLPQLQQRCTNPIALLSEEEVSIDELSEPWMSDPEMCRFGGFDNEEEFEEDFDFEFEEIDPECLSPVQRYLGFESLMRELDQARLEGHRHLESMNACDLFEMGKKELDKQNAAGRRTSFGPTGEAASLLEEGLKACKTGDSRSVAMLREKMFKLGRLVDLDQLIEEKLRTKLADLDQFDTQDEESSVVKLLKGRLADAEKKLSDLTDRFNDAQKTIFALNETLATMASQVAASVDLNEKSTIALGSIGEIPNEEVQQAVASAIGELAEKADGVKEVLPASGDHLIDEMMNALLESPPTDAILSDIQESFTAIQSYATSGATSKEVLAKVQGELATVIALNAGDVESKVEQGVVAYKDTANLGDWYAIEALKCRENGFCAAPDQLPVGFEPGKPELVAAAAVRIARLLEKTGVIDEIDLDNKRLIRPVAGAPDWSLPYIRVLQQEGVDLPDSPTAVADRVDVAVLIHDVFKVELPAPASIQQYLTEDVRGLTSAQQEAVATMRFHGIMGADTSSFSPNQEFNRAQGAAVTNRLYDTLTSVIEEEDDESLYEEDDFGEEFFDEEFTSDEDLQFEE